MDSICVTVGGIGLIALLTLLLKGNTDSGIITAIVLSSAITVIFIMAFCTATIIHETCKQSVGTQEDKDQ